MVRLAIFVISLFVNLDRATWDDKLVGGLAFIETSVLQIPFFLMAMMKYVTPTIDRM